MTQEVRKIEEYKPIIPGKTQFFCGRDIMLVIKRDKKQPGKWWGGIEQGNYTTAVFSDYYIQKYRVKDRPLPTE